MFKRNCHTTFKWPFHFAFPLATYKGSSSASLTALSNISCCCLRNFNRSIMIAHFYEVIKVLIFISLMTKDSQRLIYLLATHTYTHSVWSTLVNLLNWAVCFLVDFLEFFIYSGCWLFISYVFHRPFLPVHGLSFHFLKFKFLICMKSNLPNVSNKSLHNLR